MGRRSKNQDVTRFHAERLEPAGFGSLKEKRCNHALSGASFGGWGCDIPAFHFPDTMRKRSSTRGGPPRNASKQAAGGQPPRKGHGRKEARSDMPAESASGGVPVVGIGASAGGFEAVSELLQHLGTKTGMAYVFIQHLDPSRKSQLT